jgi:hypothetical protein
VLLCPARTNGLQVALIKCPVLGGNGSSGIWAMVVSVAANIANQRNHQRDFDHAKKSPGHFEEFGDAKKGANYSL